MITVRKRVTTQSTMVPDKVTVDTSRMLQLETRLNLVMGALFFVVGMGLVLLALKAPGMEDFMPNEAEGFKTVMIWVIGVFGALFAWAGIGVYLQKQVFTFDFMRQILYRRRFGSLFQGFITESIPFSSFEQLHLIFIPAVFSDDSNQWQLILHFREPQREPMILASSTLEEQVWELARKLMDKTGLKLVNEAGSHPETLTPQTVTMSYQEKNRQGLLDTDQEGETEWGIDLSRSPSKRIRLIKHPTGMMLEVQPHGFGGAALFMTFFSLFWNAITWLFVVFLVMELFNGELNLWQGLLMGLFLLPFIGIGVLVLGVALWVWVGKEQVLCNRDNVVIRAVMGGFLVWKTEFSSQSVTDLVIEQTGEPANNALKITTQKNMYKLASGRTLEELTWLKAYIAQAIL